MRKCFVMLVVCLFHEVAVGATFERNWNKVSQNSGLKLAKKYAFTTVGQLVSTMEYSEDPLIRNILQCLFSVHNWEMAIIDYIREMEIRNFDPQSCFTNKYGNWFINSSNYEIKPTTMVRDKRVIIQIGFNKCGTTSIVVFFDKLGFVTKKNFWSRTGSEVAHTVEYNIGRMSNFFDKADVYSDMNTQCFKAEDQPDIGGEVFKLFKIIHSEMKESSAFLLNIRPVDDWLESRCHQNSRCFGFDCRYYPWIRDVWRLDWYLHISNLLEYFQNELGKIFHVIDIRERDLTDFKFWVSRQGYDMSHSNVSFSHLNCRKTLHNCTTPEQYVKTWIAKRFNWDGVKPKGTWIDRSR